MQKCKLKFKIILFAFSLLTFNFSLLTFHLRKASAQSLALSISPPILEVMIKPGKSITQVYKLTNTGEPTIVTPKLYELGPDGIKEDPTFTPDKWITILSNDIDFDKPFLLERDKEAEFLLKVSPPAGTAEQDFYRVLVFSTTPQPPADTTMSSFVQNLGSPVLITVTSTGIFTKGAQITKFDMPAVMDSFDPWVTDIEVKNTGKTYLRPVGKISLSGPVGRAGYDIIPSAILSGQTKKLITDHLPPQSKDLKTLYIPGFYIGKYKVELDFTLDEGKDRMSQVKTFYAVPWKGGMILIILILGIRLLKSPKSLKKNNK